MSVRARLRGALPAGSGERYATLRQSARRFYFRELKAVTSLYYLRGSSSYRREKAAFHAGASRYYSESARSTQRAELRRHLHMIEKGLCMRPRRDTFATGYIAATVASFCAIGLDLDEPERTWGMSVLNDYFRATAVSENKSIQNARRVFDGWGATVSVATGSHHGPHPVGELAGVVTQVSFLELAYQRTSVRWFTPDLVDRPVVDRAVETAMEAPSACNRVPWVVRIFDDAQTAQSIAKIAMGTAGYVHSITHLAVFVGDQSAYYEERDRHLIYIDTSLAAMSFILSLQAAGVSSCCINWPDIPKREKAMANALKLKPFQRVIMLVAFGYADPSGLTPYSGKKSIGSVRFYESPLRMGAATAAIAHQADRPN